MGTCTEIVEAIIREVSFATGGSPAELCMCGKVGHEYTSGPFARLQANATELPPAVAFPHFFSAWFDYF